MGWKIPWRRAWQPTPVFLPGESDGQRSLADYSPWDHKELDTTEVTVHTHRNIYAKKHKLFLVCYTWNMPVAERKPILSPCWKLFFDLLFIAFVIIIILNRLPLPLCLTVN